MNEETQWINLGFVNAFLVKAGDGFILIDTGVGQQWSRLEAELLQAGCLPGKLTLVVITHGDGDHIGNCAALQGKYQVKIAMHSADATMAKTGKTLKRKSKSRLGALFLWLGERMGGGINCFEPDILLEDGQGLAEYGLAAKVIHTPGHTPGSIAILTEAGCLFPGDTLANQTKPSSAQFIENEQELRQSLDVLKGMKARMIYPGHGRPFPFEELAKIT